MDAVTRALVRERAGDRCEYCHLRQEHLPFHRFHIEHIVPRQHGGGGDIANLALSCHHCNLHKGPNLTGVDPETGEVVRLFHPRRDRWDDHFAILGAMVIGRTPAGRATARVLRMNSADRVALRIALLTGGELP
ncbi:MAG: HNH endonuclease [Armatimonadetes bacterium]|nr:HNH endonuclease [Armatimonadota bacterium]